MIMNLQVLIIEIGRSMLLSIMDAAKQDPQLFVNLQCHTMYVLLLVFESKYCYFSTLLVRNLCVHGLNYY